MTIKDLPIDKNIILYDGVCHLCTASVQSIIKRDKQDLYRFVSLQSDLGNAILNHLNINVATIDSIVLYQPTERFYIKSAAALRIVIGLGGPYKIARIFLLFPKGFSDIIYDFIAKNRYRWYGKREDCLVPTPELAQKFLS
jgi:predicted DCC family thiol-disulfide oxidoreductase YuxK